MPEPSLHNIFHFHKVTQISESHCGPAVLQMLLGNIGIEINQQAITQAAGATKTIVRNGIRIDEMAQAIANLNYPAQLWYKPHATIEDIRTLLDIYKYPVGVEWQGLFSDDDEEINSATGHYSIVTRVDEEKKALIIADPYKDFADQDRIINIEKFHHRWWDINYFKDETGKKHRIRDNQVLFIVTPENIQFSPGLGLLRGSEYKLHTLAKIKTSLL